MKLSGVLLCSAALCGSLVISDPADAYFRGHRGAGWHGVGWRGAGWRGVGWRGARWGWRGRWAGNYPYYGYGYNGYNYPYGYGLAAAATAPVAAAAAATAPVAAAAATTAPLITGRSVATGQVPTGNYCTTPKGVPFTNSRVMPDGQLRPYDPAIDGVCR